MTTHRTGIALGSNLGHRILHLRRAVLALRELHTPGEPFLLSPIYRTEPRFCPPGSPEFLNAVVEFAWSGTAEDLLGKTRSIEFSMGRIRDGQRNAPRTIDIDLLYVGSETVNTADLELPHPRIIARRFVLEPLAAIRPDLVLPGTDSSIRDLLHSFRSDEAPLVRTGDSWY